jgi:hypothetical protein
MYFYPSFPLSFFRLFRPCRWDYVSEVFSVLWLEDADTANLIVTKVTEKSAAEDGIDVADEWVEYIVQAVKTAEQRRYERMLAFKREEERQKKAAHDLLVAEAAMRTKERNDAHEERLARGRAVVEQRKEKGRERARVKAEKEAAWIKRIAERNEREGIAPPAAISTVETRPGTGGGAVGMHKAIEVDQGQGENGRNDGLIIEKKKRKRFVSRAKGDLREQRKEIKRAEALLQGAGNQIEKEPQTQTQTLPRNGASER